MEAKYLHIRAIERSRLFSLIFLRRTPSTPVPTLFRSQKSDQLMPKAPDKIPENIDFAAQELLQAPLDQHPPMLEGIATASTGALLRDQSRHRHRRCL